MDANNSNGRIVAAREAADRERLILPFRFESLNLAYVLLRDTYAQTRDAASLSIPDWLTDQINVESALERGIAEANVHSFVSRLIRNVWDGDPVEISMTAYGRCPLHPNDEQLFRHTLEGEKVGQITKADVVLTAETIGNCSVHPAIPLYGDVSYLEYNRIQHGPESLDAIAASEKWGDVAGFRSRIKSTSQVHKLTRAIIGDKKYALDFRGGMIICEDFGSYLKTSGMVLDMICANCDIQRIPLKEALEEYVAADRLEKDRLANIYPDLGIITDSKDNGYESAHFLIRYLGVPIEIQVRDKQMHEWAENGLALHHKYKQLEMERLLSQYPDYMKIYDIVRQIYKGMIPAELTLSQAPFSPLAHN